MNATEVPEIEPKRTSNALRHAAVWAVLVVIVILTVMLLVAALPPVRRDPPHAPAIVIAGVVGGSLLFGLWECLRRPRNLARAALGVGAVATLVACFYTVENWRGKRAWDNCKRALEGQGASLDWDDYLPPPVPDDQNFFKAPKMQEWFVGRGSNELSGAIAAARPHGVYPIEPKRTPLLEVTISRTGADTGQTNAVLRMQDPAARAQAARILDSVTGPCAKSANGLYTFITKLPAEIKPARVTVVADTTPTVDDIAGLFFRAGTDSPSYNGGRFVESPGPNSFRVLLSESPCSAADYLAATDPLEADFDLIREALKRPYARMDGDYRLPPAIPIPNFVCLRDVAQTLAGRTKCHLLAGQPAQALRDFTLIRDLCRLCEARPAGKPITLVGAMINVAVTGLYANTLGDALRLQGWSGTDLDVLQGQLKDINLLVPVKAAVQNKPAAECRALEVFSADQLAEFSGSPNKKDWWQKIQNPCYDLLAFGPRGWIYQNVTAIATMDRRLVAALDPTNCVVQPEQVESVDREIQASARGWSPYKVIAVTAHPPYLRMSQTVALNQTLVNEAFVVCALERCRAARGQYPETLDALVPQFADKLPRDAIGGQPLKYHRTSDGKFLLYSVGWNQRDDGGTRAKDPYTPEGDWVWPPLD